VVKKLILIGIVTRVQAAEHPHSRLSDHSIHPATSTTPNSPKSALRPEDTPSNNSATRTSRISLCLGNSGTAQYRAPATDLARTRYLQSNNSVEYK